MIIALESKWSLDARALFLVSLPTLFIIPASESANSFSAFWFLGLANLLSLLAAVGIIWVISKTTWVRKHWLLVLGTGALAGATKGTVLWWGVEYFAIPQPNLTSRIFISTMSWLLFVLIMAIIQASLGDSRSAHLEVRRSLAQAQQEFNSLEAQRQWLVDAKVKGLEKKLAKSFVKLLGSLNETGKGPGAYLAIARELRVAARGSIRKESNTAWKNAGPRWTELAVRTLQTKPNALVTLLAFLVSSGINTLRLQGLGPAFIVVVGTSAALCLFIAFVPGKYTHLFTPGAVVLADLAMQWLVFGESSVSWALAAGVWAFTLILTTSALELARQLSEENKFADTQALGTTKADIEWLSIQLEATNIELAKYLHSILQTRLMSHALLIEQRKGDAEDSFEDLVEILSKPMDDFGTQSQSLREGLELLVQEWRALVAIEINNQSKTDEYASSSLLLIREAISNAVHHGLADNIKVEIRDDVPIRTIEVFDNGIGPTQKPAGLGSQTYDSLCSTWKLTQWDQGGAKLAMELELR